MVKVLAGLVAAIVIAAAGFFGFEFYVQRQAANEVEAAFAAVRESGAKASYGRVSFDLWTRTITIADIAGESAAQPPVTVKIGRFTAAGVSRPEAQRFSAERIEATEVDVAGAMHASMRFSYKVPRVEITGYGGPAGPLRRLDPSVPADVHRFVLEHFTPITAASITAPSVSGTMTMPGASQPGEYSYSGLAVRDIRDGRAGVMAIDRVTYSATMDAAGKQEKVSSEIADLAAYDIDATALLAMFDPARAKDDKVYRAYRQMKSGAYAIKVGRGMSVRLDGMTANEVGIKPSKLQYSLLTLLAEAMPPPGTTPTTAQMRDLLEKAAVVYEGLSIGNAELRGIAIDMPDAPFRLGAIRLGKLENGKLAELALEDLDARTPEGPVKMGRFALKALDIASLIRMSAQFASARREPAPDQLAALLLLLDGAEIRNLSAPKAKDEIINIDTLSLNWGQFVGPIPTRARATLKMAQPVRIGDPEPFGVFASAGMSSVSVNVDLGAAWSEATRAFALEPATFELGGVGTAAARASFTNVAREMFSVNPLQAAILAAQVEAGPIEIAIRDNGGVELMVTNYARTQRVARDDARRALVTQVRATAMQLAAANPDAMAIAGAVARFIEAPGGTLTVKLTPRGKVAMMALIDTLRTDPMAALARFQVDASNGR